MATITIEPATTARFDDAQHALTGGGDGASCQCQWVVLRNKDWQATTRVDRTEMLRDELARTVAPALIAYVDGVAAGWVRVGSRTSHVRLAHTRTFANATPEPWDDAAVWTVSCFVVRREHRGAGLTAALLDAAIAHARAHGARAIEAYPVDTAVKRVPANDLFVGTLSTFLAAGFHEVARPSPHRPIVALDLAA